MDSFWTLASFKVWTGFYKIIGGFEIKNIYNLFVSDIDNKYTLEAKNLSSALNGKIDIEAIENEGMQYSFIVKLK